MFKVDYIDVNYERHLLVFGILVTELTVFVTNIIVTNDRYFSIPNPFQSSRKIVLIINEQLAGVLIDSGAPENADEYTFGLELVEIGLI